MPSGQMRSVDAARFAMVPRQDVPRSAFDVSHYHKTTLISDLLIPVYVDEVLPGDSMTVRMHSFIRTATAIVPVMDNLTMETHWFFVPNRLVWANWERFMGEKLNITDTTQFLVPQVTLASPANLNTHSLYDYMGITLNAAASIAVVSLPFRAYNLIWNDWYRDQDLQNPVTVSTTDGPDAATDFGLLRRGKKHDYFTSARPWPEKPSAETAWSGFDPLGPGGNFVWRSGAAKGAAPVSGFGAIVGAVTQNSVADLQMPGARVVSTSNRIMGSDMRAQASGANGWPDIKVLVSDMRTATLIQQMLERDARGGTRYAELVRAHFGVISPDARLQRPEYLGGGRTFLNVHPVAQTSASTITGSTTVLGEQAGVGVISAYNHGFSQSFSEHGWVLGLMSIRGDLTYQQGIERMWFRRSRFEFYWPGMNGLSEQTIQNREIYADGSANDGLAFGYQERWSEYKYKASRTSGVMRSTHATPFDMWHFGQKFASMPALNSTFVVSDTPVERVMQVPAAEVEFFADMLFDARLVRAMPVYSLPGMGARL